MTHFSSQFTCNTYINFTTNKPFNCYKKNERNQHQHSIHIIRHESKHITFNLLVKQFNHKCKYRYAYIYQMQLKQIKQHINVSLHKILQVIVRSSACDIFFVPLDASHCVIALCTFYSIQ